MASTTLERKFAIRAIVIGLSNGLPLVTLKIDKSLKEHSLTTMLSVIKNLATEILGKSNEINMKSGENYLYCYRKTYHNDELDIYICSILSIPVENDILRKQSEQALTAFVEYYGTRNLVTWDGDLNLFNSFYKMLQEQLDYFLKNHTAIDEENDKEKQETKSRIKNFFRNLFMK